MVLVSCGCVRGTSKEHAWWQLHLHPSHARFPTTVSFSMASRGVPNNRARFQLSRLNGFIASSNRLAENCRSPLTLGVALITVSSLTGYIACKWSPLKRLQKSDTENVSLNAMNSHKQYTYPMTKQRGCSPAGIYNKCWKQSECRWPRRFVQESSTFPPTHMTRKKWQFSFDDVSSSSVRVSSSTVVYLRQISVKGHLLLKM